ncbi:MAG: prepilin-type N-terminal cleavage/methylation domain-containing protein [Pedosphaera sp.]|nr:prepilin-type N-terminal cleavage/methylation domain-containing protein [Pedosphaera sp.]
MSSEPFTLSEITVVRPRKVRAFSLLELMVVVSIIGLLAAISVPAIKGMSQRKTLSSGHQQLTDDLNRARQEALRMRTTVYVVFAPTNIWLAGPSLEQQLNSMVANSTALGRFRQQAMRTFTNIALGAFHTYALLVEREVGAQPGRHFTRYLGPGWQQLPDGVILSPRLFNGSPQVQAGDRTSHVIHELPQRNFSFPVAEFASDTLPPIAMRFVAFGPDGRLAVDEMNRAWIQNNQRTDLTLQPLSEIALAVAQGSVFIARTAQGTIDGTIPPDLVETPRDNATNNRVIISSLTGRSRILKIAIP